MANNLLVLYPDQLATVADEAALIARLRRIGFIADTFNFGNEQHYKPGDEFLFLITFLGCSPVVSLGEPGKTGDEFCHIAFMHSEKARFIGGDNVKPPRCPSCGHRDMQWPQAVSTWQEAPESCHWGCPACHHSLPLTELKWRQCAGFGHYFIKIWGIFEGEAVPSEKLMDELQQTTGVRWRYLYYQSH